MTNISAQTVIKMKKLNNVYVIPCKVNGLNLNFIFDTGASDVSISMTEALFMLKNGYLSESDLVGKEYYRIANGDVEEGTKILLKTIEIGNLKLYNVNASIVHNLNAPLLFGQSALSKLGKIEFDYSRSTFTILGNLSNQAYNNLPRNNYPSNIHNNLRSNKLDFLKNLNGKYPYEVKLFEESEFTQRLKNLLGNRYEFFEKNHGPETPIKYSNGVFVTWACKKHDCNLTNFIIVYDFSNDVMYAGIREDGQVETYSENGEISPIIIEWQKN
jgi:clan AA aspartic protease (TIGR02281 family)